jgi:hypothetical protein
MIAEAESETRMAQEELNMLRNEIRFGIADALARRRAREARRARPQPLL